MQLVLHGQFPTAGKWSQKRDREALRNEKLLVIDVGAYGNPQ